MSTKALFLDRDGVININYGYVYKKENFHFINGIFEVTKIAAEKGYLIFVITNQSGIGRGYYSEDDFWNLSTWMTNEFLCRDIYLTKIYFCPYHPTEALLKYRLDSFDRKPNPGMIFKAAKEFSVNLSNSFLIGDNISDIDAGLSAGIGLNIFFNPENKKILALNKKNIVEIFNLVDASKFF